jgi:hypothetical protein
LTYDEILYGGDDIEDGLDAMLFNPVASTISKWQTFKLLRWVQLLNRLMVLDEICIVVIALKVTSIIPKWLAVRLSACPPLIIIEPIDIFS